MFRISRRNRSDLAATNTATVELDIMAGQGAAIPPPPPPPPVAPGGGARYGIRASQRWSLFGYDAPQIVKADATDRHRDSDAGGEDRSVPIMPSLLLNRIKAGKAMDPVGFNYVFTFFQHLYRAQDSGSLAKRHASPSEQKHICRKYAMLPPTDHYYPTALNLLPWRRSAMYILVLASVVTASSVSYDAAESRRTYLEYEALAAQEIRGSTTRGCVAAAGGAMIDRVCAQDISEYVMHVATVTHAGVILNCQLVTHIIDIVDSVMAWVSFVLALLALRAWDDYPTSRRRLLYGWLCTIIMPFLLSFFPLRVFVTTDPLRPAVREVSAELVVELANHLNGTLDVLTLPCGNFSASGALGATAAASMPTQAASSAYGTMAAGGAYSGLDIASSAKQLCDAIPLILAALSSVAADPATVDVVDASQRADEHLETIVRHLSLVVEGMVGIINAGATLRTMLPVAISLAPGLLRGASE